MLFTLLFVMLFGSPSLASGCTPLPPSSDAFYVPPLGYQLAPSGTILSWRSLPPPAGINASVAATYQILFRSIDSQKNPTAVMTTLIVPTNADTTKVLSLQPAYDSAAINCAPSYSLYDPSIELFERIIIQTGLQQGWYVNVPDYEGYRAAFANGLQAGYATLDSVRAVVESNSFSHLSPSASVVLAGVSGGALASGWAVELRRSYAPFFTNIKGVLLSSLTPNITSVLETVDGTIASGLIPIGLLGLATQYLDFSKLLSQTLNVAQAPGFMAAAVQCGIPFANSFGTQNVLATYFTGGAASILQSPTFQSVMRATGIMGLYQTPTEPIFMVKGTADEISPIADTDDLVAEYCHNGADVQYYRIENGTHAGAGAEGFVLGFAWVAQRLAGLSATPGCQTMNITS